MAFSRFGGLGEPSSTSNCRNPPDVSTEFDIFSPLADRQGKVPVQISNQAG
jgi:hypothetical protein